jgi:endonuclease/exonuclease/phosphatase family metal-dependent hydrolase
MRFRLLSAAAAVVTLSAVVAPAMSGSANASGTTTKYDVRVGSFNLSSLSFDGKAGGDHAVWRVRRPVVAQQIINQKMDVVGLQEANQSSIYPASVDYGSNQYLDLKGQLAAEGATYALTNENSYNCLKPMSTYKCQYVDQGASQDNRILYNPGRVKMLDQGSIRYSTQTAGKNERYLAWAVFQVRSTGKEFFFTDTHLDPYSVDTRRAQWNEMIDDINRLKGTREVVAVGDFNTSKWDADAATLLPKMRANGYGDVLNQQYQQSVIAHPRAEARTHGWVNSYNGYTRNITSYAYEDAKNKVGNGIDWIFATNSVRVKRWSVVARIDANHNQLTGVIPSDHAMVKATLVLD